MIQFYVQCWAEECIIIIDKINKNCGQADEEVNKINR